MSRNVTYTKATSSGTSSTGCISDGTRWNDREPWRVVAWTSCALFVALALGTVLADARAPEGQRLIVVYEDSVRASDAVTQRLERVHGFRADHRFSRVVKGFAARLSPGQASRLRDAPVVTAIVPDLRLQATELTPLRAGETVPTGIRRIGAATPTGVREASGARVAVLDTGIDLDHPDLNATDGVNCVGEPRASPAEDDDGHGTHVAGIIGARNQGAGVVGLTPGTEVVAVKVLARDGGGWTSDAMCGIEWVTATRADSDPDNDIVLANLSLGTQAPPISACPARDDPLHAAICSSTATGVTYVAAAGNDRRAFDDARSPFVPAAFPEVLTVTAMSDTDGRPGGSGPGGCSGDDVAAPFSNFASTAAGRAHTIAAPGSCILSTRPDGRIARRGGTSVAAPHVAGLAALCHDEGGVAGDCAGRPPAENVERLADQARAQAFRDGGFGFDGARAGVTSAPRTCPSGTWPGAEPTGRPRVGATASVPVRGATPQRRARACAEAGGSRRCARPPTASRAMRASCAVGVARASPFAA